MPVQIPFPIPSHGYALNSKMRINLEFLVDQFNEFNTGAATWDTVAIGTPNNLTGTLTFWNASNAHYLTFQAGATAVDTTYTWPITLPLTSSPHLLTGTTSGVMAWDTNEWLVTADQPGVLITGIAGAGTIINIHNTLGAEAFVRMDNDTTNPKFVTLLGTSSQVIVTHNTNDTTLSLPQSIGISSAVTFQSVTVDNGSLGSESIKLGSGGSVLGIYNSSGVFQFTTGGTLRATIDGGGNITAIGSLLGQALKLEETGAGTDTITIQAPSSIAASYTLTLPIDDGNSGEVLSTNGSGVLSWVAQSSGANTALSNLASVAINTTLVSDTNNTDDLGTSSIAWKDLYLNGSIKTSSTTFLTFGSSMTAGTALAMGSNKITGLAAGTTSGDAVAFQQIHMPQIPVLATSTGTTSTTTTANFVDTGLTASITPTSSSSKILVIVSGVLTASSTTLNRSASATIKRDSTNLGSANNGFSRVSNTVSSASGDQDVPCTMTYLDSPSTTSAVTYTVQIRSSNSDCTAIWNRSNGSTSTTTITLIEVI